MRNGSVAPAIMNRPCGVVVRYARAAELSKQRDLLSAWERDGHLKNLNKLKALGPAAMRDYLRDTLADATRPAVSTAKPLPASFGGQSQSLRSGRSSSRPATGAAVGFDPRA